MAEYLVQDTTLTAIADAVRAKKGTTEPIALTDFATEIESIQSGGSASNKLALVVGKQSANNPYDIIASDLEGVTEIGDFAFYQNKGLRNIELPSTCTKIGVDSFFSCDLISASMPNVISIGNNAFIYCYNLMSVSMTNVTMIDSRAFFGCPFTSIDIPNATSIGDRAFGNCRNLPSVIIPNVVSVGESAFGYCYALTSISMPNVTSIGNMAFDGCTSLATVYFPSVTSIGSYAFRECPALTSLTIPSTCTSIGDSALQCGLSTNKCTFTFDGTTPPSIQSNTFNTSYINKIIVPAGCGEAYKTATNWTTVADYIVEATE